MSDENAKNGNSTSKTQLEQKQTDGSEKAKRLKAWQQLAIQQFIRAELKRYASYFGILNVAALISGLAYLMSYVPDLAATKAATQLSSTGSIINELSKESLNRTMATEKELLKHASLTEDLVKKYDSIAPKVEDLEKGITTESENLRSAKEDLEDAKAVLAAISNQKQVQKLQSLFNFVGDNDVVADKIVTLQTQNETLLAQCAVRC